jgi:hypothetical protein
MIYLRADLRKEGGRSIEEIAEEWAPGVEFPWTDEWSMPCPVDPDHAGVQHGHGCSCCGYPVPAIPLHVAAGRDLAARALAEWEDVGPCTQGYLLTRSTRSKDRFAHKDLFWVWDFHADGGRLCFTSSKPRGWEDTSLIEIAGISEVVDPGEALRIMLLHVCGVDAADSSP